MVQKRVRWAGNLNYNGSLRIPFDLKIGDNQTSEGDTNLTGPIVNDGKGKILPCQIRRAIYSGRSYLERR
jgi:hypothetical protein